MRRRAFSIIELLVVVGILSILIALILPTFAKARQQSRLVTCQAQLQNIGTALSLYLMDHRGRYPAAPYSPTFNPARKPLLSQFLAKYVPSTHDGERLFSCPADELFFPRFGLSYSYQQELGERDRLEDSSIYRIMKSSSTVPVLWDADDFHGARVPYNWLFADGHVDGFLDGVTDSSIDPTTRPQ